MASSFAPLVVMAAACLARVCGASENESSARGLMATSEAADRAADELELLVLPIPQSNPTIGTGLALPVLFLYDTDESGRPWMSGFGGLYTDKESWAAGLFQKAYLRRDALRITAGAGYGSFNVDFYGIGAGAGNREVAVPIRQEGAVGSVEALTQLSPGWFAGVRARFLTLDTTIKTAQIPPEISIPDAQLDSVVSGLALAAQYDTRDNELNARRGTNATLDWFVSRNEFGSDFGYEKLTISYNRYLALRPQHVFALRASGCLASGDVPFFDLCLFGSHNDLRGYISGQYRDEAMFATQVEYRWRFYKRFGIVLFGGTGSVAATFGDFSADDLLYAGGVGLRVQASREYDVNVSIDVATAGEEASVYFYIGEAF